MKATDKELLDQLSRACSMAEICVASHRLRRLAPDSTLATINAIMTVAIEAIPIIPIKKALKEAFKSNPEHRESSDISKGLARMSQAQLNLFFKSFAGVQEVVVRFAESHGQKTAGADGEKRRSDHRGGANFPLNGISSHVKALVLWAGGSESGKPQSPPNLTFTDRVSYNAEEWLTTKRVERAANILREARILHYWRSSRDKLLLSQSESELPLSQRKQVLKLQADLSRSLSKSSQNIEKLAKCSREQRHSPTPMRRAKEALAYVQSYHNYLSRVNSIVVDVVSQFDTENSLTKWLIERIETQINAFPPVVRSICDATTLEQLEAAESIGVAILPFHGDAEDDDDNRDIGYCLHRIFNTSTVKSIVLKDFGEFAAIRDLNLIFSESGFLPYGREEEYFTTALAHLPHRMGIAFRREGGTEWNSLVEYSLRDSELRVVKVITGLRRFAIGVAAVPSKDIEHISVVTAKGVIRKLCEKFLQRGNGDQEGHRLLLDDEQTVSDLLLLATQLCYLKLDHRELAPCVEALLKCLQEAFSLRLILHDVFPPELPLSNYLLSATEDASRFGQFPVTLQESGASLRLNVTLLPQLHHEYTRRILGGNLRVVYKSLGVDAAREVRDFLADLEASRDAECGHHVRSFLHRCLSMGKEGRQLYSAVVEALADAGFFPRRSEGPELLEQLTFDDHFVLRLEPSEQALPLLSLTAPGQHGVARAEVLLRCPKSIFEANYWLLNQLNREPKDDQDDLRGLRRIVLEELFRTSQDQGASIRSCVRKWADCDGKKLIAERVFDGRQAKAFDLLDVVASCGAAPDFETLSQRLSNLQGLRSNGIELTLVQTQQYLFSELSDELVVSATQAARRLLGEKGAIAKVLESLRKFFGDSRYEITPSGVDAISGRHFAWEGEVAATEFSEEQVAGNCVIRQIGVRTATHELLPCEVVRFAGPTPIAHRELIQFIHTWVETSPSEKTTLLQLAQEWPVSSLESETRHQQWFCYRLLTSLCNAVLAVEDALEKEVELIEFRKQYYNLLEDLAFYVTQRWGFRLDVVTSKQQLGTGWQRYVDFTDERDDWPESSSVFCVRPCIIKADGNSVVHKGIVKSLDK